MAHSEGNRAAPAVQGRSLSDDDHPRERLLRNGAAALSDTELLAILLRTGCPGATALEVARDLLSDTGGLPGLISANGNLVHQRGVGRAKASTLLAAVELARRLSRAKVNDRELLDAPDLVANYLLMRYSVPDQEVMGALYLDVRNRLIPECEIYRGTLTRTVVEPRAILKEALIRSACGLILFHNHPSGDPTPSPEDLEFTRRMVDAGEVLGIRILDHIILGSRGRWVALHLRGSWWSDRSEKER